MKKQGWIKAGIAALAAILMILLSFVGVQTVMPTGLAFMPLAGIIAVGLALTLNWLLTVVAVIVATVVVILLGNADWVTASCYLVILLAVWLIIHDQLTLQTRVSHQQLRWLAVVTGLVSLIYLCIIYGLIGWVVGGTTTASLAFIQQIIPIALLTGLLYGFLVAPVAMVMRWGAKKVLQIDDHHDDQDGGSGSVIVDLSDHHDKKEDK
ncbi:hypothetical protein [Limosilactobacillus caccae]|uniref:hypothetical protein n=1 Tax=Limosilactobacillus caccae TaxID=1926284 RepID=UPI000970DA81|nr:hypothetical protein [Limosilactobacillus caccae]